MSVSYAPVKVEIPPGFEVLLQDLAREVLRSQPEDITAFAANYFKKKLLQRNGESLRVFSGKGYGDGHMTVTYTLCYDVA